MQGPESFTTFLHEAGDLLARIEEIALDLGRHDKHLGKHEDREFVNELFRAFHTIKGSGSMFGFNEVAEFTHHVEAALDKARSGAIPMSKELVELVLLARDQIQMLLEAAQGRASGAPDSRASIIGALTELSGGEARRSETASAASPSAANTLRRWKILFRPELRVLACGANITLLIQELRDMGTGAVTAHTDAIPDLEHLDPENCHLWWEIDLTTGRDRNAVRDVFIFVEDGSELTIEECGEAETAPIARSDSAPSPLPAIPAEAPQARISVPARANAVRDSVVRVPSEKLDRLVNLVGELVMNQSRLARVASRLNAPELSTPVEEIERLVSELRDDVLSIRMMPIGSTFGRFRRLVHDVSAELGKEIDLITEGAETELDKSVLDQMGDPLVHLMRNSVDHGIEAPEEREKNGKARRGRITLSAVHTGSSVVVRIEDDGRGLDARGLRARAVERRLIAPDAELTEKETYSLIFVPGFSTARQVTNISGRGVGMDVVKRQIEALRGSVSISSSQGRGMAISLTLPLTLAIIDGLLVEIGEDQFIIPMSTVTENVELHRYERGRNNGRNVVAVRGELLSYIRLRESFGILDAEPEIEKIVIVRHEDQRVGLVVDRVLGSHQTVIQSLGRFYKDVQLVSGATIMGDGRVALILNVPGLVQHSARPGQSIAPPVYAAAGAQPIREVRV